MKPIICRLPDELHEELRRRAFEERVSMAKLVRSTLEEKYRSKSRLSTLSEPSLRKIWDNPEDATYDKQTQST